MYGFGEQKTPSAFVSACDKFVYTEVLRVRTDEPTMISRKSAAELRQDTKLVNLLRNAVEASSDEAGWSALSAVGSNLTKQSPEFDSRNYGYVKLSQPVSATQLFDMDERPTGAANGNSRVVYVRDKRSR